MQDVRVCQEAGARVARNVRLANMNIDVAVTDDRRIEVVANGLPCWHGSQQAVDATIVSPVTRNGEEQPGADVQPGRALLGAARRKRRQTYPELVRARRCRLVVLPPSPWRNSFPLEVSSPGFLGGWPGIFGGSELITHQTTAVLLAQRPCVRQFDFCWYFCSLLICPAATSPTIRACQAKLHDIYYSSLVGYFFGKHPTI